MLPSHILDCNCVLLLFNGRLLCVHARLYRNAILIRLIVKRSIKIEKVVFVLKAFEWLDDNEISFGNRKI